jgi:hypothetical protein
MTDSREGMYRLYIDEVGTDDVGLSMLTMSGF